jgi:hypothetical protein
LITSPVRVASKSHSSWSSSTITSLPSVTSGSSRRFRENWSSKRPLGSCRHRLTGPVRSSRRHHVTESRRTRPAQRLVTAANAPTQSQARKPGPWTGCIVEQTKVSLAEHAQTYIYIYSMLRNIVLPARKSVFRAGFGPDCYQENTEIGFIPFFYSTVEFCSAVEYILYICPQLVLCRRALCGESVLLRMHS